jgi:hypothetical protein
MWTGNHHCASAPVQSAFMITGRRTAGCSYRLMPMLETLAIDDVIEVSRLGLPKALANYPTAFSASTSPRGERYRLHTLINSATSPAQTGAASKSSGAAADTIRCRSPKISANAVAIIVDALSFVSGVAAVTIEAVLQRPRLLRALIDFD